jgi:dihydrofolate reductase
MTTTYFTATTLDGFIATEDDSLEWLFKQKSNGVRDDERFLYDTFITGIGAMAMGATTYQWILDHQEKTGESWGYDIPSWVFTHREFPAPEGDVRFATDVSAEYPKMQEAAGDRGIWVVGGGDLVGQFADHGWLDEVIVSIAPVTLGRGRGLLARELDLEFVEAGLSGPFLCARLRVVKPATMTQ